MRRRLARVAVVASVIAVVWTTSVPAQASLLPPPPTGVAASPYNGHSIDVWWQPDPAHYSYVIEARRGAAIVARTTCRCWSVRVDGLAPSTTYAIWVWTVDDAGLRSVTPATVNGVTTLGQGAPDPPGAVTAAADTATPAVAVDWVPPAAGAPASFVEISAVPAGSSSPERIARCMLPPAVANRCNGNVATIIGLTPGRQYVAYVSYGSASAVGLARWSAPVTVASGCAGTAQYCVDIDGTRTTGTASRVAAGLLHSSTNVNQARLQALQATNWRLSVPESSVPAGTFDFTTYAAAMTTDASITLVLSDAWAGYSKKTAGTAGNLFAPKATYATPPWSNWDAYTTWVAQYVTTVEQQLLARGWRLPDYWEVVNEPDGLRDPGYFSSADAQTATLANVELLFEKTFQAVKAADPTAQLLGPSLMRFVASPAEQAPDRLDLATFLQFSDDAAPRLQWAGLSWHENSAGDATSWTHDPEEVVVNHAATARSLLAQHPNLGSPALLVNEYGPPDRWVVPGWQVGFIDAAQRAGLSQAAHACFGSRNHGQPGSGSNCFEPVSTLNGQVAVDGTTTYPIYWVGVAYAAMSSDLGSGTANPVVVSSASHPSFGAFATRDPATSTVTALIGRHETCVGGANLDCGESVPPAVDVPLVATFPFAAPAGVRVRVQRIPMTHLAASLASPVTIMDQAVTALGGNVALTLPQFADGDAMVVTLTPA